MNQKILDSGQMETDLQLSIDFIRHVLIVGLKKLDSLLERFEHGVSVGLALLDLLYVVHDDLKALYVAVRHGLRKTRVRLFYEKCQICQTRNQTNLAILRTSLNVKDMFTYHNSRKFFPLVSGNSMNG